MSESLENERFDIFISYTHEDNRGIGRAWVSEFKDDLAQRIKQRQGRPLNIYLDKRQSGIGGTLPDLIEKVLENSKYLLPIVSPLYNESEWCELERIRFIENYGLDEAMKRLVRVDKEPVEDVAGELEDLKGYRFYHRDEGKEMDFVITRESNSRLYDELITELAFHILHEINVVNKSRDNTIYLAKTSKKLNGKRNQLSKDLEERGFNVVPASLGIVANKARDKAGKLMDGAFMSIHLIDEEFEPIFKGESDAIDRIQFEEAAKRIDELDIFIWTPSNEFSDPKQETLLEEIHYTNGPELMHDFHDFKDEITNATKKHQQRLERQAATESAPTNVYLYYGPADEGADEVVAIAKTLTAKGIEVFEPDFDLEDAHVYSAECSAILYYFGSEPYGKVYYSIKTGKDLSHTCLARGIYLKQGVRLKNPTTRAVIIEADESNDFNEDALIPFYRAIGAAK